jgi:tetratricopeptide (TPR) repeat protein
LGRAYLGRGKLDLARQRLEDSWTARRDALGADHPDTLASETRLGELETQAGRFSDAERLLRDAVQRGERRLGPANRTTLDAQMLLADLLQTVQRYDEAEPLYRHVIGGLTRLVGPDDDATASANSALAVLLTMTQRFEEAEPVLRTVADGYERRLGPNHSYTLDARSNLAGFLFMRGDSAAASSLMEETLGRYRARFGDRHPVTIKAIHNLSVFKEGLHGSWAESEALSAEAVRLASVELGEHSGETALYRAAHGMHLLYSNRINEAEPELILAYSDAAANRGAQTPEVRSIAGRLAELYEKLDRPEQAAEWKSKSKPDAPLKADVPSAPG